MSTAQPSEPQDSSPNPNQGDSPPFVDPEPSPVPKKKRGRPRGSVSLTNEIAETIIGFVGAGSFGYVAAEAAGISARTFREWMARGEGTHPTRPSTPKLRKFAKNVRKAEAEARIWAEARLHQDHPDKWLKCLARSRPEREGWTDVGTPAQQEQEQSDGITQRIIAYHERRKAQQGETGPSRGALPGPRGALPGPAQHDPEGGSSPEAGS